MQRTLPAGFIAPCLPTKTDKLPAGDGWLHEIKHGGFRIIARKTGRAETTAARNDPTKNRLLTLRPPASRSPTRLNDPQATYAFDLVGLDGAATSLEPPPAFASARMATDLAEVYWRSLTRDVPFREYESHTMTGRASRAASGPIRRGLRRCSCSLSEVPRQSIMATRSQ
jgi:hypothetical protein